MAGCLFSGAEHAPGTPSTALKQPPCFIPALFCLCRGLVLLCRFPRPGTTAGAWQAAAASWAQGRQGVPGLRLACQSPRLCRHSPQVVEDPAPQQAGMNRGCSHEGLQHWVLNHQLLISHVKSLSSSACPGGGSRSLPMQRCTHPTQLSAVSPAAWVSYRLHPMVWHAWKRAVPSLSPRYPQQE